MGRPDRSRPALRRLDPARRAGHGGRAQAATLSSTIEGLAHGQVWWADLDDKVRPIVVLTRARVAPLLRRVLVAPVTSTVRGLPTEVVLGSSEGVKDGTVANLDNVQLVPVDRLLRLAGIIPSDRWPEVCRAMGKVMAC